ncbi:hypothetical protein FO519_008703 [Halicephalobus sp. NKZ332]|nr:hypothetical protein FO519_008703 [Halicephalobus sp. NKZ332]
MTCSMASRFLVQILMISILVLAVFTQAAPAAPKDTVDGAYITFPRQLRSPFDVMMLAEKREKPLNGYGWDQCEFSPMSCLLRRRRSIV